MTSLSLALLLEASMLAQDTESYASAYHLATQTGRPMVVFVGAEWCGPCQTMKREVIPQVKRRGLFGRVAFASVNVDRERELGKRLTRGGPIPQLLMFRRTARGWRLSRLTGGQNARKVEAFINHGLNRDAATKAEEGQKEASAERKEKEDIVQTRQVPKEASREQRGKSG
jgi:thioredoxin-like negative regulator of GroEL